MAMSKSYTLEQLYNSLDPRIQRKPPDVLLALDPGETTGWCVFKGLKIAAYGQLPTKEMPEAARLAGLLIEKYIPTEVVIEEYRIYKNKAKEHIGSDVHTIQLIGSIKHHLYFLGIPFVMQGAGYVKQFFTDDRLKGFGKHYYVVGKRHTRDAVRHACWYLLFRKPVKKQLYDSSGQILVVKYSCKISDRPWCVLCNHKREIATREALREAARMEAAFNRQNQTPSKK